MHEDAADTSDRTVAGGSHDLDDLGLAAFEHAAHPRERLVVAEVRRLGERAAAMLASVGTPIIRAIAGFE